MPKGIFIGIGGTGVTTVARLKALLFQRAYGSSMAAMNADCTFIFYDTDSGAKDGACKDEELRKMMGANPVIDEANEYIDAGTTAPYSMYREAKNAPLSDVVSQRMLEWAIDPDVPGHFQLPPTQLSEGAGAQRMAGRTGLMFKRREFESIISAGVNKLEQFRGATEGEVENAHPAVWVFSSACGGTSSSALLDVLYLVDRLYKKDVVNVDPYLRLVLYMPKAFIDKNPNNTNYLTNSYATLWELNEFRNDAVLNNDGNKFGAFAALPDRNEWAKLMSWKVCRYVMAVDVESQRGKVSLEQMYANTAELCYFIHTGAAGGSMVSQLDNDFSNSGPYYGHYITSQTDQFKWSQFLVGSGYRAVTKADDYLKEYIKKRFLYDFYGYGLIGLKIEEILPKPEERLQEAKEFAANYILRHLVNIDNFGNSNKNSLYGQCALAFGGINIPSVEEKPSKDDWNNMGTTFVNDCKTIRKKLTVDFGMPSSSHRKDSWMQRIEESVKEGIDKCIVEFGLNYAYSLLTLVDDDYCQKEVMDKLKQKNNLGQLEKDIDTIIRDNKPKKGIADLVPKMEEYKNACIYEVAVEQIRSIIEDITQEKKGLLEYLRKGDQNHKGIQGLIQTFNGSFNSSSNAYRELASTFKKTSAEVCADYFPHVSEFVKEGDVWERCHLFEDLYSSIVPLDFSEGAKTYESTSFGCPPLRKSGDRGLSPIISAIKNNVTNHNYLFSDMALSNPMTEFGNLCKDFVRQINKFVEDSLENSNYNVKTWLDKSLEEVFDEYFTKD